MNTNPDDLIEAQFQPGYSRPGKGDAEEIVPGKTVGGLTKREYFAACALQGVLASLSSFEMLDAYKADAAKRGVRITELFALEAVQSADALITELNKQTQ